MARAALRKTERERKDEREKERTARKGCVSLTAPRANYRDNLGRTSGMNNVCHELSLHGTSLYAPYVNRGRVKVKRDYESAISNANIKGGRVVMTAKWKREKDLMKSCKKNSRCKTLFAELIKYIL